MNREGGVVVQEFAKSVSGNDCEARGLERHYRSRPGAAIENHFSKIFSRPLSAKHDFLALLVAYEYFDASGNTI
jgi:hypothetical protein